jgi:hypothetical protein
VRWQDLGIPSAAVVRVRDLWAQRDLSQNATEAFAVDVAPHATALLRLSSVSSVGSRSRFTGHAV